MPAQEGELEAAMLLGHKDALRDPVQDAFRAGGVSHLLAVSGLHVALLCGIFSFGRKRRFVRSLILLRAALVLFYMFLTGLPVSVLRAGLVFLLALAGDFFLQPVDLLTSTGAVAILIGLQNAYAPCDVGFQLSFCAVVGVQLAGMLCRWQRSCLPVPQHKMLALARRGLLRAAEAVQVAVFAGLATLPVLVAHGLTASGVSVLTNLLVVWMLQPALQLGVAVLLLSVFPPLQPLVRMASLLLSVWLHWMTAIIVWCANLPAARVDLPARYTLLVLAVLGALAVVFWRARKMLWYLPAAGVCTAAAVALGVWGAAGRRAHRAGGRGQQPLYRLHPKRAGSRGVPRRAKQPAGRRYLSGRTCVAGGDDARGPAPGPVGAGFRPDAGHRRGADGLV